MVEAEHTDGLPDLLDLHAVHRAIQELGEDGILNLARAAAHAERGGWFARARAIGELQRRGKYREAVVTEHARRLRIGRSTAFELGAIDRYILFPRLSEQGDAAQFPIQQRAIYAHACKLAQRNRRSPLEILALAEGALVERRRVSRRLLEELLGYAHRPDPTKQITRSINALSKLSSSNCKRFARNAPDRVATLERVAASMTALASLTKELRSAAQQDSSGAAGRD